MKKLLFVLTCAISFGIFATGCSDSSKTETEEKKEETKPEEKKEEVKAPDFNTFFDKFKAAVTKKDYSMIEFPLYSGGLDKNELKEADLKNETYQQILRK
jgi:LAS superfamily LD-carboxypeptidase LdcB